MTIVRSKISILNCLKKYYFTFFKSFYKIIVNIHKIMFLEMILASANGLCNNFKQNVFIIIFIFPSLLPEKIQP